MNIFGLDPQAKDRTFEIQCWRSSAPPFRFWKIAWEKTKVVFYVVSVLAISILALGLICEFPIFFLSVLILAILIFFSPELISKYREYKNSFPSIRVDEFKFLDVKKNGSRGLVAVCDTRVSVGEQSWSYPAVIRVYSSYLTKDRAIKILQRVSPINNKDSFSLPRYCEKRFFFMTDCGFVNYPVNRDRVDIQDRFAVSVTDVMSR